MWDIHHRVCRTSAGAGGDMSPFGGRERDPDRAGDKRRLLIETALRAQAAGRYASEAVTRMRVPTTGARLPPSAHDEYYGYMREERPAQKAKATQRRGDGAGGGGADTRAAGSIPALGAAGSAGQRRAVLGALDIVPW